MIYPDKPSGQITRESLTGLSGYMAMAKLDGWRCIIEVTDRGLVFTSRHQKVIPISDDLADQMKSRLRDVPVGTILDGEWLSRRPAARNEALWLFDLIRLGGESMMRYGAADRYSALVQLIPTFPTIAPIESDGDYGSFFDHHRENSPAVCEGIVLKRIDSPYIGSRRKCANNPGWLKCKWRGGEDGCTELLPRKHDHAGQ